VAEIAVLLYEQMTVLDAAWRPGGQLRVVFAFDTYGRRITLIDLVADPARLAELTLEFAPD
jgi:hypothetical protein